jgi:hypothetical protein
VGPSFDGSHCDGEVMCLGMNKPKATPWTRGCLAMEPICEVGGSFRRRRPRSGAEKEARPGGERGDTMDEGVSGHGADL